MYNSYRLITRKAGAFCKGNIYASLSLKDEEFS